MKHVSRKRRTVFEQMSHIATKASGSTAAFIIALSVILLWLISGPLFDFSDTWQLVINTGTTIITFLMVFLIQRSQNKDSIAIHLKLNELILTQELASNNLVAVEEMSEEDLVVLQRFYRHLAAKAREENSLQKTHSIDEANAHHERKQSIKGVHKKRISK